MRSLTILPCLFISDTRNRGRGVFTSDNIEAETIIEVSPVIVMNADERKLLDQTLLHDYIFEWELQKPNGIEIGCCMALGYVAVYNHSYTSNCEYEMDFEMQLIKIKTVRAVKAGQELFINYNGDWNNTKPVWFDVQ